MDNPEKLTVTPEEDTLVPEAVFPEESSDAVPEDAAEESAETAEEIPAETEEAAAETADEAPRGLINPGARSTLRYVIGIYLIYLGISLIRPLFKGEEPGMPVWVAIVFSILFIVVGGGVMYMQYKETRSNREDDESNK